MATTKSKEVEKAADTVVAEAGTTRDVAVDPEVFRRFLAAADESAASADADEVMLQIVTDILNATTVDDVLGGVGAIHARDYLNTPFTVTNVKFHKSTMAEAEGKFFAVLEGADRNGEKIAVTCGAHRVIAQIWKLADLDALPIDLRIEQAQHPTANGFYPMWLARA